MTDMMDHGIADRNGSFGTALRDRLARLGRGLGAALQAWGEAEAQPFCGTLPTDEIARDTGLSPEEATGIKTWRADRPFFLQSGFGQR